MTLNGHELSFQGDGNYNYNRRCVGGGGDPGNQDAMSQVSKKVRNSDLDSQGEDEEIQFSVWPITLK